MKIEIRNGSEIHISGYVNAVERESRVLPAEMSPEAGSPFVEKVAAGAFGRAIGRNPNVRLYFNHDREIGSVKGGQLSLKEDNIGLFARAVITDEEAVRAAQNGEFRGWSFGFSSAKSKWEQSGENLKRRTLTDFDLTEVSILTKTPAYFGTSVEMRQGEPAAVTHETRFFEDNPIIEKTPETRENALGNEGYFIAQKQIELLKLKGEIYD